MARCFFSYLDFLTTRSASVFGDLSELEELLVGDFLYELLEASSATDVVTLDASVVTAAADARNYTCALYALLEAANNVRAAFVVVLVDLYIGCHKWQENSTLWSAPQGRH
jgi:hypothetical protein